MRIQASKIPQDGLEFSFQESLDVEGLAVDGPVQVTLTARKVGGSVIMDGALRCGLRLECSACLEPFRTTVTSEFTAEYRPQPKQVTEGEVELTEPELEISYFQGDEIDLVELIREQVVLGLPMSPLCREDCRGLCPVCGGNRNMVTCGCRSGEVDPRFSILQRLKGEGHGESNK